MSRKLKLPVPVTIITGALGSGKTTCLRGIIAAKPKDEVWAILINEFGAVGIDALTLQGTPTAISSPDGSVTVRQIAGGCMCCVLAGPMNIAIAQVIRQVKPDRLILEPSGLGHPAGKLQKTSTSS